MIYKPNFKSVPSITRNCFIAYFSVTGRISDKKLAVINKLQASLTDDTTDNKRTEKCQSFAKLKEVFCQRTCRHKNTTFNFAQPHPKPTHHPTSGMLKIGGNF
jgi:hypothetical protein